MNLGEYMGIAGLIGLAIEGSGPPPEDNDGCGCGCSGIGCFVIYIIACVIFIIWGIIKIISFCNF